MRTCLLPVFLLLFAYAGFSQGSGTALTFNGSNQLVNSNTTGLNSVTNNFTIEFWANPSNTLTIVAASNTLGNVTGTSSQRYAIFATHGGGSCPASTSSVAGIGVSVGTNGIQVFEHRACHMPALLVYNSALPSGWNHIAVVVISKQPQLYLNGNLVATGLTSNMASVFPGGEIGGNPYGYYQGSLDEIRIWNSSRTQTQLRDNMCKRLGGSESGLIRYYRFDNGSGTTLTDASSSGQHGTLVNTPTWATSGAPIGNTSSYHYTTSWSGVSLYHVSPEGDSLQVSAVSSATVNAIHIYHVTSVPNTTSGITGYGGNDHYFGVFKSINSGGSGTYTATYYYRQNDAYQASSIVDPDYVENNLRVFTRSNNSTTSWTLSATAPNTTSKTIALTAMSTEFMLGYLNSTAALPVELISFEAKAVGSQVILDWCTASEHQNAGFIVEKSLNGFDFYSIDSIPGSGSSSALRCYQSSDGQIENAILYYRLVQVDFNGTKHYSGIKAVEFEGSEEIMLYPNPATEQITVEGWEGEIEVMDLSGRMVYQNHSDGNLTIPCGEFPKGIYLVKLRSGSHLITRKLILH